MGPPYPTAWIDPTDTGLTGTFSGARAALPDPPALRLSLGQQPPSNTPLVLAPMLQSADD